MRIGEFGAAKRELSGEKDDFVFCGETFTVQRPMPAVLMLQLGASMSASGDDNEGMQAMWEALRISLMIPERYRLAATDEYDDADEDADGNKIIRVPEDDSSFRQFYQLAVDNDVGVDDMMKLVLGLFEAQTGRPTRQAPGSSAGQPSISPSSNTSSHLRSVDSLLRGEENTLEVESDSNIIQMGDGTLVEVEYSTPTGQTG